MVKMMRGRKHFARCHVEGHGSRCERSAEVQSKPFSRAMEKAELLKELSQPPEDA